MMVIAQNSSLPSELLSPQARPAVTRCVAAARASILLPNIRLNTALSIFSTKWPAARALLCHAVSTRDACLSRQRVSNAGTRLRDCKKSVRGSDARAQHCEPDIRGWAAPMPQHERPRRKNRNLVPARQTARVWAPKHAVAGRQTWHAYWWRDPSSPITAATREEHSR